MEQTLISNIQQELSQHETMLLGLGKKLRGELTQLMANAVGLQESRGSKLASTAELLHNATLVHDDVIDESYLRRGKPTPNSLLGNRKAVLLGDYLFSQSVKEVGDLGNIHLVLDLSKTLNDLVLGEWMQVDPPSYDELDESFLYKLSDYKTGSLIRWCLLAPLRFVTLDEQISNITNSLAINIGRVYQMMDDIIDFSPKSGKSQALDLKNKSLSFVLLQAYQSDKNIFQRNQNIKSLDDLAPIDQKLIAQVCHKIEQKINQCFISIEKDLAKLELSLKSLSVFRRDQFSKLTELIFSLRKRAH